MDWFQHFYIYGMLKDKFAKISLMKNVYHIVNLFIFSFMFHNRTSCFIWKSIRMSLDNFIQESCFFQKKTIFQRSKLYIGNQLGIDKQPLKYWSIVLKKWCWRFIIFFTQMTVIYSTFFLECIGSYGENCKTPCHKHCINQTCDKFNGSCLYGCKEEGICVKGISIWILETFESCTLLIIYKILWS